MNAKEFGKIIQDKRKQIGITQKYLAAISNTGIRFISDLENGKPTVQLDKAFIVAKTLNIEIRMISHE
ncbi:MAG: helix-turn-helix domain-containing protein [Candidatus Izemoplasmatales bacterium]